MSVIPLNDATRRPARMPVVTLGIILVNFIVFFLELAGGDAFVMKWSEIPAHITAGQDYITILTSMFMHGGWSHIIGNMIFLGFALVPYVVGGALMLGGSLMGLYWVAAAVIVSFIKAIGDAWVLLVEINR